MTSQASMLHCWRRGHGAPGRAPYGLGPCSGARRQPRSARRHPGGERMPGTHQWCFGPFRLDPTTGTLWRDDDLLPLPPKPFAVLAYLVAHAGQVVSKETLLEAVWPDTAVTEG